MTVTASSHNASTSGADTTEDNSVTSPGLTADSGSIIPIGKVPPNTPFAPLPQAGNGTTKTTNMNTNATKNSILSKQGVSTLITSKSVEGISKHNNNLLDERLPSNAIVKNSNNHQRSVSLRQRSSSSSSSSSSNTKNSNRHHESKSSGNAASAIAAKSGLKLDMQQLPRNRAGPYSAGSKSALEISSSYVIRERGRAFSDLRAQFEATAASSGSTPSLSSPTSIATISSTGSTPAADEALRQSYLASIDSITKTITAMEDQLQSKDKLVSMANASSLSSTEYVINRPSNELDNTKKSESNQVLVDKNAAMINNHTKSGVAATKVMHSASSSSASTSTPSVTSITMTKSEPAKKSNGIKIDTSLNTLLAAKTVELDMESVTDSPLPVESPRSALVRTASIKRKVISNDKPLMEEQGEQITGTNLKQNVTASSLNRVPSNNSKSTTYRRPRTRSQLYSKDILEQASQESNGVYRVKEDERRLSNLREVCDEADDEQTECETSFADTSMSSMTSTQGIPLTMTTSSTATPPPLVELSGLSKSPPRRSQSGAQTRRKRVFSTIKVVSEDEITDDAKAAGDNTILLTRMPSDPGEETSTSTSGRAKHPSIASVFGREALQLMEEKARNHSIITAQKARLGRGQHTQQSKSESALYSPNGTELDGSNGNDADSKASSSKSSMAQHDKSYSMHNRTVSLEEVVSAASTSTSASTSASSHTTRSPGRNTDPLAVRHISPSKPLPAPSGLQREAQAPPVPPTRSASRQRAKGMDARRVQRATVLNATGGSNLGSGKGILDELQKHQKEQLNSVSPITRSAVANSLKIDDQMFQGVRLSRQSMLALAALKSPTRFHRMSSSNYYTADSASVSKPLDALTDPSTQRRTSRLSTLSRSRSVEIKDSRIITDVIAEADTALQLAEAAEKRRLVVSELVNTEAAFASDLDVLIEVYHDAAKVSPLFRPLDIRVLFTNIEEVRVQAHVFVEELAEVSKMIPKTDGKSYIFKLPTKSEAINDGGSIGNVFIDQLKRMEHVYTEYCKRYDSALERLQDLESQSQYQQFFLACREQLAGRTTSWDLGSLLIKPVQRVLKYPLLVQEILKHTDAEHADHRQLLRLSGELQNMADRINEVKRRKEVVEGIVGGRKRSVDIRHGLQKRFNRNTRKLLQKAGRLDESVDEDFNVLHQRFLLQQRLIRVFLEDAETWVQNLKSYLEWQRIQATSLEDVYLVVRDPLWKMSHGMQILTYRASMAKLAVDIWQRAQRDVQSMVREPIERLLELYKGPQAVINKRAKKLIDYDRARDMRQRNDKPDRMTQASAEAYVAINAQLIEELPLFFQCTGRIFNLIAQDMVKLQSDAYLRYHEEAKGTFEQLRAKGFCRGDVKDVVADHQNAMEGEFGFTTLLMELSVVNGSWRDIVAGTSSTSISDTSIQKANSIQNERPSKPASFIDSISLSDQATTRYSEELEGTHISTHNAALRRKMKELRRSVSHGSLPGVAPNGLSARQLQTIGAMAQLNNKFISSSRTTSQLRETRPGHTRLTSSIGTDADMTEEPNEQTARYLFICLSLYPYTPASAESGQLSLSSVGSTIGVISLDQEGDWWYGKDLDTGSVGWFPASYCQRLS